MLVKIKTPHVTHQTGQKSPTNGDCSYSCSFLFGQRYVKGLFCPNSKVCPSRKSTHRDLCAGQQLFVQTEEPISQSPVITLTSSLQAENSRRYPYKTLHQTQNLIATSRAGDTQIEHGQGCVSKPYASCHRLGGQIYEGT